MTPLKSGDATIIFFTGFSTIFNLIRNSRIHERIFIQSLTVATRQSKLHSV